MRSHGSSIPEAKHIAGLFDQMASEYDDLADLWYSWLFSRLHYLIGGAVCRDGDLHPGCKALDVGCGTGFQSILLSLFGFDVNGLDISPGLVQVAASKSPSTYLTQNLFKSPYRFTYEYWRQTLALAAKKRGPAGVGRVSYKVGSATRLPFADGHFDLVNCCGSTLSFVDDYGRAMQELVRVLRPGGVLILEVESKYNMDLAWMLLDGCFGVPIGFDEKCGRVLGIFASGRNRHGSTLFPFSTHGGEILLPIRLYSRRQLFSELRELSIRIGEFHGIHGLTNIIPSVVLDHSRPTRFLQLSFSLLRRVEALAGSWPVVRALGCSMVIVGKRLEQ
ncbi:MAG: class I SAM-dependent methyltransferase [Thermoanaerobaculia bacterium]